MDVTLLMGRAVVELGIEGVWPMMNEVNGKYYPLWSQFVDRKQEWIGGILQDQGDSMDRALKLTDGSWISTEITDVKLEANGKDSAMFYVDGKDFGCGFDVGVGGVTGGEEGWITFSGYGGHTWRIKQKVEDWRKDG